MKINKAFKIEKFLADYKDQLIRTEWLPKIIETYFNKYDLTEYYELNQESFYIVAKYKKEKYRIYYRKEINY